MQVERLLASTRAVQGPANSIHTTFERTLATLRAFAERQSAHVTTIGQITAAMTPVIIDLGRHVVVQPSRHTEEGQIVVIQQLTCEAMFHQAFIAGQKPVASLACLQRSFWQAPGAFAACADAPGKSVAMVFTCCADYQSIFQPGLQAAGEAAAALYKLCVQAALDFCGGYECQEVNAVFMLTFPDCWSAVRYHLVLQQILLIADWTPTMLRLPPLKPEWDAESGALLFRGARVKTGIFVGTPRAVSPHGTTGRADYWGELVNRAARMMSAAKPGQVLCDGEVARQVSLAAFAFLILISARMNGTIGVVILVCFPCCIPLQL